MVQLGHVVLRGTETETNYAVNLDNLKRHIFVAGVTGAGKTNTIFGILKQALKADVPFLVVEPAKTEYRAMLNDPAVGNKLRVFTLGDEMVSPFRLNPFEVPEGTPVAVHVDLLRSVFSISFGMWTPLPQILEQCLHGVYEDCGWDLTTNTNPRVDDGADVSMAFPTLTDLYNKVDEVASKLGYEQKITDDMRAALRTRINSLRTGGKGHMLDVKSSVPMAVVMEAPTVMELEGIGDDDDKAFIMGILFIRLVEHLRSLGESGTLRHVFVIEEAHRLLSSVERKSQEEADPRSKAVETFAQLLSEIRAYGQGIIVADQVPVKLTRDVLKNTAFKIAHRIVDQEDREALAGAMAMTQQHTTALGTFDLGQVAAFADGDDAPVLVKVPKDEYKDLTPPDDKYVADHMRRVLDRFVPRTQLEALATTDGRYNTAVTVANQLIEEPTVRRDIGRLLLGLIEINDGYINDNNEIRDETALDALWKPILAHTRAAYKPTLNASMMNMYLLKRSVEWYGNHRGAQAGWSYSATHEFIERAYAVLYGLLNGPNIAQALQQYQIYARRLHQRPIKQQFPYPHCHCICDDDPPLCLYRFAVNDLIVEGTWSKFWNDARQADITSEGQEQIWRACLHAAQILIGPQADFNVARRVGLCYGQLMLRSNTSSRPKLKRNKCVNCTTL